MDLPTTPQPFRHRIWYGDLFPTHDIDRQPFDRHMPPPPPLHRLPYVFPPHPSSMKAFQEVRYPVYPRFNFSSQRFRISGLHLCDTGHTRCGSQSLLDPVLPPAALFPPENAHFCHPSSFSTRDFEIRCLLPRDYDDQRGVPDRRRGENRFGKVYRLGPDLHDERGCIYEQNYDDGSRIFVNDYNIDLFSQRRLDGRRRRVCVLGPNFHAQRGFGEGSWESSSDGPFRDLYSGSVEGDRRWPAFAGDPGRPLYNGVRHVESTFGGISHLDQRISFDKHWNSVASPSSLNVQDHRLHIDREHRHGRRGHGLSDHHQCSYTNTEFKNWKRGNGPQPKGPSKGELSYPKEHELQIRSSKRRRIKKINALIVFQDRKDCRSVESRYAAILRKKERGKMIECERIHERERENDPLDSAIPFMSNVIVAEHIVCPSHSDVKDHPHLKNKTKKIANTMTDLSTKKSRKEVLKPNLTREVVPRSDASGAGSGFCENSNVIDLGSTGLTCLSKNKRLREQHFHENSLHSGNDTSIVDNCNESVDVQTVSQACNLKRRRSSRDSELSAFAAACLQADSHGRRERPLSTAEDADGASMLKFDEIGCLVHVDSSLDQVTNQNTGFRINLKDECCAENAALSSMANDNGEDANKDSSNHELVSLESFTIEEPSKIIQSLEDHENGRFGLDNVNRDSSNHELVAVEDVSKITSPLDDHGSDTFEVPQGNLTSSFMVDFRQLLQKPENVVNANVEQPGQTHKTAPQGRADSEGMTRSGGLLPGSIIGCSGDENASQLEKEKSLYLKKRRLVGYHHSLKARTWHRSSNNANGVVEPKLPPTSLLKVQKTTENADIYMRKGNTLVRKPLLSRDGLPSIQRPVSRLISCCNKDRQPCNGRTHGADTSRPSQLPDKQSDSPILAMNTTGNGLPCQTLETSKEGAAMTSMVPICNADLLDNSDCRYVVEDEKSRKEMRYIKRKRYQLVAVPTPAGKSADLEKSEASSLGYFKSKDNQLVRKHSGFHNKKAETCIRPPQVLARATLTRPSTKRIIALSKAIKYSNFSFVWKLHDKQSPSKHKRVIATQKFFPHILPWKKSTFWRSCKHAVYMRENSTDALPTSKKFLFTRKRGTFYVRSSHGYSLRMYRAQNVYKSARKWVKSTEKCTKEATEENISAGSSVKESTKDGETGVTSLSCSIPRDRTFLIGSERYKMDPSRRTLQRITAERGSSSSAIHSQSNNENCVPRKFFLGCEKYVRIGKGNQLVRDPKKRTRVLASEKIRRSLHTARLRLARKRKYCQFFTRYGKCNKDGGKCPYIHDPSKIVVCTKFLSGSCSNPGCKLTHKVIPERMQDCSYFLKGSCSNDNCPYRHANINPNSSVCESFLRGYCVDGNECPRKHTYVCPAFEGTGRCPQASTCKLHHPKIKADKTPNPGDANAPRGRYFDSELIDAAAGCSFVEKPSSAGKVDVGFHDGKFPDYISLDVSDDEEDPNGPALIPENQTVDLDMETCV